MTDISSVITTDVIMNGDTSMMNGVVEIVDAVKDVPNGDVKLVNAVNDIPNHDVELLKVDSDVPNGDVELVDADKDVPNGVVKNGDDKVVEVIDLTEKEESKKPSKLLGKFNDIRNFFFKMAAPSSTSNKRKSDHEDEPPAKKRHLDNCDRNVEDKEDSDCSTDKQLVELSQLSDVKAKQPVDTTTADVSRGTELKTTLTEEDLRKSCKLRKVKILIHRLEETEHCNEALKEELEKLKELKKQESVEYEVEAVLDYAWCKETVFFLSSDFNDPFSLITYYVSAKYLILYQILRFSATFAFSRSSNSELLYQLCIFLVSRPLLCQVGWF